VEALTDRLETDANEIIKHIDDMGGVVEGIHQGYFRRAIAEASYRYGQEMETHDRIVVGVNAYTEPTPTATRRTRSRSSRSRTRSRRTSAPAWTTSGGIVTAARPSGPWTPSGRQPVRTPT
jgi:methylmalonyl-CoA mutase N-terminal domain/subunit